jgi:hypothetical protein
MKLFVKFIQRLYSNKMRLICVVAADAQPHLTHVNNVAVDRNSICITKLLPLTSGMCHIDEVNEKSDAQNLYCIQAMIN